MLAISKLNRIISKAFDSYDRINALYLLNNYGITGKLFDFFGSFLAGWHVYCDVG